MSMNITNSTLPVLNENPPGPASGAFDDLIALSLPDPSQNLSRRYVWSISINVAFLGIGLLGARAQATADRVLPPMEDTPLEQVEVTQAPPPAATQEEQEPPDHESEEPEAPPVVAVTLDSPAVSFSVPTVGNLLVKASAAQPPPATPLRHEEKEAGPQVFNLQLTDSKGDFPAPSYPLKLQSRGVQGTVVVYVTVDANGQKQDVQIKESSGSAELDQHVQLWVLQHWIQFPRGKGTRIFKGTVIFQIK
jgi:protein TonB